MSSDIQCINNNNKIQTKETKESIDQTNKLLPKYIYVTKARRYRVQMSMRLKDKRSKKFSKNAETEIEALWICEVILLAIDAPNSLQEVISNGNYKYLHHLGHVSSPTDFLHKLIENAQEIRIHNILQPEEWEKIDKVWNNILRSLNDDPFYIALSTSIPNTCSTIRLPSLSSLLNKNDDIDSNETNNNIKLENSVQMKI
jgi:hypothetical protein